MKTIADYLEDIANAVENSRDILQVQYGNQDLLKIKIQKVISDYIQNVKADNNDKVQFEDVSIGLIDKIQELIR